MIWTVDGASYFLASIASSVVWLVVTSVLWVCGFTTSFNRELNFWKYREPLQVSCTIQDQEETVQGGLLYQGP